MHSCGTWLQIRFSQGSDNDIDIATRLPMASMRLSSVRSTMITATVYDIYARPVETRRVDHFTECPECLVPATRQLPSNEICSNVWKREYYGWFDGTSSRCSVAWSILATASRNIGSSPRRRLTDQSIDRSIPIWTEVCRTWSTASSKTVNRPTSARIHSTLADRTNGRAYATVLRPSSSSVCDVMYCG